MISRRSRHALATAVGAAALGLAVPACTDKPTPPAPVGSASAAASSSPASSSGHAAPTTSAAVLSGATPLPPALVASVLNPAGRAPYEGPFGQVEGVVRYKGPPPEVMNETWPRACGTLPPGFDKSFRVTGDGLLGDAVVGVTEFEAYVPPAEPAAVLRIEKCQFDKRTVTIAFGQRVEIKNDGDVPVLPRLHGARNPAVMVAVPHGDAVRVYPQELGRFQVADDMGNNYLRAEVLVFRYSTHAVTDTSGKFLIGRVPVGKVKVSARHPKFPQIVAEKEIEVKDGAPVKVELLLEAPKDAAPAKSGKPAPIDRTQPR